MIPAPVLPCFVSGSLEVEAESMLLPVPTRLAYCALLSLTLRGVPFWFCAECFSAQMVVGIVQFANIAKHES